MGGARMFRGSTLSDLFVLPTGVNAVMACARLIAGSAAATAQLVDGNGTVLADMAAATGTVDDLDIPVEFVGKVAINIISGTGAVVNVFIK